MSIRTMFSRRGPAALIASVVLSVFLIVGIVEAATTISTNISTGGTLAVTGASTLTGTVTVGANVLSDTDSTDSLGITGTRWASTFSDNFTGNTITLDGATTVNVLTITNNVADALSIVDSSGDLAVFDTTTGTESLSITPDLIVDTTTLVVDVSANGVGFGTTTPRDLAHVENASATSTLIISSGSAASGGRIILEDTDGAGCSEISILNGTVIAETVTCPTGI